MLIMNGNLISRSVRQGDRTTINISLSRHCGERSGDSNLGVNMKAMLIIFITLYSLSSMSQIKLGNTWVTGYSGNSVNFNSSSIVTKQGIYFPSKYFTYGNSNICDTNGNLIIASDGYNLYDSTGLFIEGGDTLIPVDFYLFESGFSSYSQGSILLPMDSAMYYHVTPTFSNFQFADCQANGNCYFDLLLYNLIDMKANSGAGKVTQRMIPLMQNARLRKTQMMACRHSNGKDWWLLKNEGDSANIHTFLFTQDSVYDKGVQVFNEPVWGASDIQGQSTFNSDGSIYASTSHGGSTGYIFIANFDRCYGILDNPYVIQMPLGSQHNPYDTTLTDRESVGLAFSPNNKYLYVISYTNVYQYDLHDSTWFHVAGIDTVASAAQGYETAYLGPDNKIYIGNCGGLSKQMSRIDNPDVKGAGCNFCPRCLRLDSLGANAYVGTPPCMPNYGLGPKECWPLSTKDVVNKTVEINIYPNPAIGQITITESENFSEVKIYTLLSQLVFEKKTKPVSQAEINTQGLPSGIYMVQIDGKYSRKMVVE